MLNKKIFYCVGTPIMLAFNYLTFFILLILLFFYCISAIYKYNKIKVIDKNLSLNIIKKMKIIFFSIIIYLISCSALFFFGSYSAWHYLYILLLFLLSLIFFIDLFLYKIFNLIKNRRYFYCLIFLNIILFFITSFGVVVNFGEYYNKCLKIKDSENIDYSWGRGSQIDVCNSIELGGCYGFYK